MKLMQCQCCGEIVHAAYRSHRRCLCGRSWITQDVDGQVTVGGEALGFEINGDSLTHAFWLTIRDNTPAPIEAHTLVGYKEEKTASEERSA